MDSSRSRPGFSVTLVERAKCSEPLRYLAVSTMEDPDAMGYPESGKFAVFVGPPPGGSKAGRSFEHIGRTGDAVGYWEGE